MEKSPISEAHDSKFTYLENENVYDSEKHETSSLYSIDTGAKSVSEKDDMKKDTWGNQFEFILSVIGYAVGIGNLWRFPYICMRNGGGAFLIPYAIFLLICGMPLFFMELAMGQFTGCGPILYFEVVPLLRGIGWGMVIICTLCSIYFNSILTWIIYYFAISFQWDLPWSNCNQKWNTDTCYSLTNSTVDNFDGKNISESRSAAQEYWLFNTLEVAPSPNTFGGINWKLFGCSLAGWFVVFLCLFKGIRSSGKVVYVTAIAPYVFLFILLIRGATLPGSAIGLKYYIIPDFEKLKSLNVWQDAALQIFFSLGPCYGGMITMASYNRFNHKILRDSLIIPVICCLSSLFIGFVIFLVLGFMMYQSGLSKIEDFDITHIVEPGPGLAFIAFPSALSTMPGGAIWSVMFFLVLFTVALDSQFVTVETALTGLIEQFPNQLAKYKTWVLLTLCILESLIGIIFVTKAGIYYYLVFDNYCAFGLAILGLAEIIVLFIYGPFKFFHDIESMVGKVWMPLKVWFMSMWLLITPVAICFIIIISITTMGPPVPWNKEPLPTWIVSIGWFIAVVGPISLPIVAVLEIVKRRNNWRSLFRPSENWEHRMIRRRKLYGVSEIEIFTNKN